MDSILELSNSKSIYATLMMIFLVTIVGFIVFILIKAYKGRKESMLVKLPELSEGTKMIQVDPAFEAPEHITVELFEEEESTLLSNENRKKDNFASVLTKESGVVIAEDLPKPDLPEVQEMDYEKTSEEIRKEKERQEVERERQKVEKLRNLAKEDAELDNE